MKMSSAMSLILVSALTVGCASTPPPIPPNFDFTRATIVAGDKDPEIDIDGLSGKHSGAAVGAASGAGAGLGYAAIACLPAAMFYAVCLAAAAPVMGGIGAAGGAAVGAATTQSAASVEEKREMLNEALVAIDARNYLATLIKQQLQQVDGLVALASGPVSASAQTSWTLRIALIELSTGGSGEENAYFLKASAALEVLQTGKEEPLTRKDYHTQTQDKKTTAEWLANENETVPTAIEYLLTTLASDMLKDLLPDQMTSENQLEVHPLYAKNNPKGTTQTANSLLDSKQIGGPTVFQSENHKNGNLAVYDPTTGMNWVIVDSSPVDLGTANKMCKTLDAGDKIKYRLPSFYEFENIWNNHNNNEMIKSFDKKEYTVSDEDQFTKKGYSKTFNFNNGWSGNLFAANVACIGK